MSGSSKNLTSDLAINLCPKMTQNTKILDVCNIKEKLKKNDKDILENIAQYLFNLELTELVAKCFPKLVLQMISVLIPIKSTASQPITRNEKENHVKNCIVLGKLLHIHPDVLPYSLQYFHHNPAPFEYLEDLDPKQKKPRPNKDRNADLDLVECCYSFLTNAPHLFRKKWKWSILIEKYIQSPEPVIKWLTCKCIAILSGMSEIRLHQMENIYLGESNSTKYLLHYECSKDYPVNRTYDFDEISDQLSETLSLNEQVVDISGILLPVYDLDKRHEGFLVPVKSTQDNLRSLALSIATGRAICLVGPVGCGKTTLVEHLAAVTGRTENCFNKVQLGDQTDCRTLLGTYRCTDVPGEFVWQSGVLTQAVQHGQWLLLEDIDCAAVDVASVLSSLLERNVLSISGYRDAIPVSPGFQLFFTQRVSNSTSYQKQTSNASAHLLKYWTEINIEPLSRHELKVIVETLYPKLKTISSRMIDVFMLFSAGNHNSSLHNVEGEQKYSPLVNALMVETSEILATFNGRLISTRDLIKWCSRAIINFDITSKESALKVLQDAIDIFVCSVPDKESRLPLCKAISAYLGIVDTNAVYFCNSYKPCLSFQTNTTQVGRAVIPRKEVSLSSVNFQEKKETFSFTRSSTCLLERIACCVSAGEPVLLVGETGTGKTSTVQYLAKQTGNKLVVINMNQQSDSADLLGGYKPVDLKYIISPIRNEFEALFRVYYDVLKNVKFLEYISVSFDTGDWKTLFTLMKQSQAAAVKRLKNTNIENNTEVKKSKENLNKSTNMSAAKQKELLERWLNLGNKLNKLELQIKSETSLAFSFIEGSLVKAVTKGYWVLLDEINLASAETLECLSGLLEGQNGSICLLERGDSKAIERHPNFILFACMNPATDVGKRDLPGGLRNRFTEFFVDELTEKNDLLLLVNDYLKELSIPVTIVESIYKFYINIKKEAKLNLTDGTGQCPHYSLRTLCRALSSVGSARCATITHSLYEALCMSFLTQLDSLSHPKVQNMVAKAVLGNKSLKSILGQSIPEPKSEKGKQFVNVEGYWICQGKNNKVIPENYILTPSVRKNLKDLVRIISIGKLPVLLQGDTSVGKTSLITYIAQVTGNHCVRINNHQHTDLQEYIGSYVTDITGKLSFKEGVLVEAMRKGYWIILDELNLAPSDVLEALNRVLDDNRELFIPETQQVVKADSNFMLFATQNPPGLYGGRKLLSRAFRNRFVELHFDEIPRPELETILHERCHMPPTYCKKIVSVMAELQARRKGSAAVLGKEGFITLRDLFRWGQRYKAASDQYSSKGKYYDWDQHIADEGYLVLAGRVRQPEERLIIQEVLQKHIKRTVDPENLFSLSENTSSVTKSVLELIINSNISEFSNVVWTLNMRRLAVLIAKSFTFNEPVLLVGETGCGKTTICQVLAALRKCKLISVNCHMHTEGADFLGGLRPVRNHTENGKLFEWVDGPLVEAMRSGDLFLADEISLADDSVLERLNSLLETERKLLIAERGIDMESDSVCIVLSHDNFQFIGTMNPGGDYGKKELSPALRNRFTEIWCDSITKKNDLILVLEKSVASGLNLIKGLENSSGVGECIFDFYEWFKSTKVGERFPYSMRDLISWVQFINTVVQNCDVSVSEAYVHGANLIFLDSFGTGISGSESSQVLNETKKAALEFMLKQIQTVGPKQFQNLKQLFLEKNHKIVTKKLSGKFGVDPFYIKCGDYIQNEASTKQKYQEVDFTFVAPTTGINTMRLLRGLQLNKPILLEGSPGVGKTSLVSALAKASGHKLLRMNLSDQTDISDLFGADLPTPEGSFAWQEGAFLTALQNGDWILLDELNLAPQSVLEGLNACLDHRGEVFIPELGRTFKVKLDTKIFACQNPLKQGGSRRGLPKSFLNRFTQVYIDTLTNDDLMFIISSQYSSIPETLLQKMIQINSRIVKETSDFLWGHRGSPWELNLRDIQRWCDGLMCDVGKNGMKENIIAEFKPGELAQLLYVDRMRTNDDKERVKSIYKEIFHPQYPLSNDHPAFYITETDIHIGSVSIKRNEFCSNQSHSDMLVLRNQLPVLKSVVQCINMNWLAILIGPTSSGKNSCVQVLAQLIGKELHILPVVPAMDTSDLIGGFEQTDYNRHLEDISVSIEKLVNETYQDLFLNKDVTNAIKLLSVFEKYNKLNNCGVSTEHTMEEEVKLFLEKVSHLQDVLETLSAIRDGRNQVEKLGERLNDIKTLVEKERNINAGGKFEWVDSLLVKCLLKGSWLLVDNVNLCSSAVLDRLNGLLEPNGVLSIPERGGSTTVIKPHSDFRLFFTVDPRNGEISRAMRNRGVEIYILGNEDYQNVASVEVIPDLDLSAMLAHTGLSVDYHKVFKILHEVMCSFVMAYSKPSQIHLLKAAFLTNQQLARGESVQESIIKSFSDIYIKPRVTSDFPDMQKNVAEYKNEMLLSLENCLLESLQIDPMAKYACYTDFTYSCLKLYNDSSLEIVKHNGVFLNLTIQNVDISDLKKLSLFLYYYYHFSNYKDLNLRYEYVNYLLNHVEGSEKVLSWISNINQMLYQRTQLENLSMLNSYPWDRQFVSDLHVNYPKSAKSYNRLSLCLYYLAITSVEDMVEKRHNKAITVLEYSRKIESGEISDFSDVSLLKYCSKLIEAVDTMILNILSDVNTKLSNEKWCQLIPLLNWRNRFHRISKLPLFVKIKRGSKVSNVLSEDVIILLTIHYKWLMKYLVKELSEINLGQSSLLMSIKDKIDASTISLSSPLRSVGKHLKKYMGHPTPYLNEHIFKTCAVRETIMSNHSILSHQKTTINAVEIEKIVNGTLQNIRAMFKTFEDGFLFPEEDLRNTLCNEIDKYNTKELSMEETENKVISVEIDGFCSEMQLWPLKDYLILKAINIIKLEISQRLLKNVKNNMQNLNTTEVVNAKLSDLCKLVASVLINAPWIPIKLHSVLGDSTFISKFNQEDSKEPILENSSELYDLFTNYIDISPATNCTYWLNLSTKEIVSSDLAKSMESECKVENLSLDLPHLTYNTLSLANKTLSDNNKEDPELNWNISTLTAWKGRSKQLHDLHKILWRNMSACNITEMKQHVVDAELILANYERMVLCLLTALTRKDNEYNTIEETFSKTSIDMVCKLLDDKMIHLKNLNSTRNHIISCLRDGWETVQQIKENMKQIEKMNEYEKITTSLFTGKAWILYASSNILLITDIGTIDPIKKNYVRLDYVKEDTKTIEGLLDLHLMHNIIDGTIPVVKEETDSFLSLKSSDEIIPSNIDPKEGVNKHSTYRKLETRHPHCPILLELMKTTNETVHKLNKGFTYRPSDPAFINLSKDLKHFIYSLASPNSIGKLLENLNKISDELLGFIRKVKCESDTAKLLNSANHVIRECSTLQSSLTTFYTKLHKDYSTVFPDLTKPVLNLITQLSYGISLMKNAILKMSLLIKHGRKDCVNVNTWIANLVKFPVIISSSEAIAFQENITSSQSFADFLKTFNTTETSIDKMECYRLLKVNLKEIANNCEMRGRTEMTTWESLSSILSEMVTMWQRQQRDIEKKKLEEDLLYVNKMKCDDKTEEEQFEDEISELFPSFSDRDFYDFKMNALEQHKEVRKQPSKVNDHGLISMTIEDMSDVSKLHSQLVKAFTQCEWISNPKYNSSHDYVAPLLERFKTLGSIVDQIVRGLDESLDSTIISSLLVFVAHTKSTIDGEDYLDSNRLKTSTGDSTPNFYHDPWVVESKKCLPTLQMVVSKTLSLLKEWPDFPTLNDIMTVVNRILNFSLTSPVARFLTGLELLRDKIEEWNKSAHKGNTMIDASLAVAQHIVSWRRLELNSWKNSLNHSHAKCQAEADKWWFHIYVLIECYIHEKPLQNENEVAEIKVDEVMTSQQFITAIKQFLEKSSIGEFHKRLDIVYTFHCHVVHLPSSTKRDEVLCILWNLHKFYSQFSDHVSKVLKDKRTPIEKKLKDFVKICSWERDLSYWAVKELVQKSHRIVRKHTKEYEEVLKESVAQHLVPDKEKEQTNEPVGIWDRPKRSVSNPQHHYMVDPQQYVASLRIFKKYFAEDSESASGDQTFGSNIVLLPQLQSLFTKSQRICRETYLTTPYPVLIQSLDGLVAVILDTSKILRELEVSPDLTKAKQKSQVKNFLQQKKKGLADLFKGLAKIGISYRTGLVEFATRNELILDFSIPPIDLKASFNFLKNKRCDTVLLSVWDGCELYYQRCLVRMGSLLQSLRTPAPDLGLPNAERCKGNAIHFMLMVQNQKTQLAKSTRYLCLLRNQVTQIVNFCESESPIPDQERLSSQLAVLKDAYCNSLQTLEQFKIVLKACPREESSADRDFSTEIAFDAVLSNSPLVHCFRGDTLWTEVYNKVNGILVICNKQRDNLNKLDISLPMVYKYKKTSKLVNDNIFSNQQYSVMKEAYEVISDINSRLSEIVGLFNTNQNNMNPVVSSLINLQQYLRDVLKSSDDDLSMQSQTIVKHNDEDVAINIERLISSVLLTMQEIYKKYVPNSDENKTSTVSNTEQMETENMDQDEADEQIIEGHLKKELTENINIDISNLNIAQIILRIDSLISILSLHTKEGCENASILKKQLLKCVPLLEQMTLLIQFFVTQQIGIHRVSCKMLSVLLNIFIELASKGFCMPSDSEEDSGEGEGQGKSSGGIGLADGEGEKDVSERIENQDQLDDAQIPGEEKKDEQKDCKEEEKGVDMTDDFDSHLQDVEPKEGEESDNEDDEDADKQMGETDTGVDKLDQQIWGSDDENDDEEKPEQKEEEQKGDGKSLDDNKVGAKEDGQQEDESVGEEKNKENKKKDINEMQEPEYDDDQVDPYHGNQKPLPEPEPMDLPDDLNIDDQPDKEDEKDEHDQNEEPFEIDAMKDKNDPNVENKEAESNQEEQKEDIGGNDQGEETDDDVTDEENAGEDNRNPDDVDKDESENNEEEGDKTDSDNPDDSPDVEEKEEEQSDRLQNIPSEETQQKENEDDNAAVEEEKKAETQEARPSADQPSAEDNIESSAMNKNSKDKAQTNPEINMDDKADSQEQSQEHDGEDRDGVGQSELDKTQKGHSSDRTKRPKGSTVDKKQKEDKKNEKRNKPGETEEERVLGEAIEPAMKKLKMLNIEQMNAENQQDEDEAEGVKDNPMEEQEADMYQHISQAKESDIQAIDTATKEQAENQPVPNDPEEKCDETDDMDDIAMEDDSEDLQIDEHLEKLEPEKLGKDKEKKQNQNNKEDAKGGEEPTGEVGMEVEGEVVPTHNVGRGADTSYHTQMDMVRVPYFNMSNSGITAADVRQAINVVNQVDDEQRSAWHHLWGSTSAQARLLTERLRLVLEPTGLSRLAGDYRTGRRINMRRVIPYIASHFRKDRIWLRRTKPARREYQIAVAVDDSSSMCDNNSKELAFESLALVSQALNLLEAGELAVLSFGEDPQILHPFGEQFTESSGCKLMQNLTFNQTKTKVAKLVEFATAMFQDQCKASNIPNAKLLLIVSDGRGIFSEGETKVIQAVRRARQSGVFMVYLIVDNPQSKDSIMDIRTPIFDPQTFALTDLKPYLDSFPFPFYLILRDISSLPSVLSDALRQWFELAANVDKQ